MSTPVTTRPEGDEALLLCPRCGEDYLHQGRVEVFDRSEDAAGVHTTADGETVRVDADLRGNPSARRQGLTVAFTCEFCADDGPGLRLTIAQVKGRTFLAWEETPWTP